MYHNNFLKIRISALVHYKLFQKKDETTRYTISGLHERKRTSLKHIFNVVMDNTYTAGDIFIMLEYLFCIIFVLFGDVIFC